VESGCFIVRQMFPAAARLQPNGRTARLNCDILAGMDRFVKAYRRDP
jgi:hypothetical protein